MSNFEMMRKRLEWQGGIAQEDRMIKDKWRTLLRTLKYSYQACDIALAQAQQEILDEGLEPEYPIVRALINPDKNKQDYDDKILSVDYIHQFKPGDVFEWKNTGTHWIIYLQQLTEDAYFRGEIRRCRYKIKFKDEDGNICYTYAAIRGPVETQIDSIQKNQERIDKPNLSLNILMPRNEVTTKAFDRYKEFILDGRCWKVKAVDPISMAIDRQGVLEVNAQEDYINEVTDDEINEIKDGLIVEPDEPTPNSEINGETFIKPAIPEIYSVDIDGGTWCIRENNVPVDIEPIDNKSVQVTWKKMTSGQFTLVWNNGSDTYEKVIVVESLF